MDVGVRFFYIVLVCTSAVTVCFAILGLAFSSICLNTVHFNLRVLIFTLGAMWCIIPIGGLYFFFILDAKENPPILYQRIDYQIAKNICAISGYAFRVTETAICIERLLATVFFETYEKKKIFKIYSVIASFITIVISVSFSVLFNILRVHIAVIYTFLISVEFMNFTLMYILKKQNHKLRQLSNSNRIMLSSKYQLIENIKSLKLLIPQATISFVMSNGTLLITSLIREFYNEGWAPPIYFIIYNMNIVIVSIYWVKQSAWYKMKAMKLRNLWSNKVNDSTEVVILKATTVKTALGQNVKAHQTVEDHIKDLKKIWK